MVIATPSQTARARWSGRPWSADLHVFCEKPFDARARRTPTRADRRWPRERGLVTQVGYHNRFVGAFARGQARCSTLGAIGAVTHVLAEAYGPVVLKPKGATWRSQRSEGGGCLYDYAAHPINLLNWYLGEPIGVGGTVLSRSSRARPTTRSFSTLYYADGATGADLGQLVRRVAAQDDHPDHALGHRRAGSTPTARRCQVYLRDTAPIPDGYEPAGTSATRPS